MNEEEQPRHQMVLEKTFETGAEEWYCPTCGRRFIMNWPPNYKRNILEPGDENAVHIGGKGGVSMNSSETSQEDSSESLNAILGDELYLSPWIKWMDEVKFESLWDRDI